MKKIITLALALILVLSIAVSSFAAPVVKKVQPAEKTDIEKQIDFIYGNLSDLSQDDANSFWNYMVTDLDHNGNLELIAAICKAPDYKTYAKVFEVGPERDAFVECDLSVAENEPFVDIICDSADTFYDKTSDTWHYLFSEDFTKSSTEHYAVKCSISLKDGYVKPASYATEFCETINGFTAVTYQDLNGNIITPEEFNNAGTAAFKGFDRSGTNFSWFTMKDAKSAAVLTDSYNVFTGDKEPEKKNDITIVPAPKNDPFLMITKNPTSEYCSEGGTATFIAKANNATSTTWWFSSPAGDQFSVQQFAGHFGCMVTGGNSSTLTVYNVTTNMNNWGAYCVFTGNGQTAQTSTAYLNVNSKPDPYRSTSGTYVASGSDGFATAIYIPMVGKTVYVSPSLCSVAGSVYDGCPCTVYYTGNTPTGNSGGSIYRVDIVGIAPAPTTPPDDTWQCSVCYNWNVGGSSCTSCGSSRYNPVPVDTWQCSVCYQWNAGGTNCTSCGSSRYSPVYDTWQCYACKTQNNGGDYCSVCGRSRYESELTWQCGQCGAWNHEIDTQCNGCGAYRYYTGLIEETGTAKAGEGWMCGCGTWNGEYDVYCAGCGMSRSGTGFIGDVLE